MITDCPHAVLTVTAGTNPLIVCAGNNCGQYWTTIASVTSAKGGKAWVIPTDKEVAAEDKRVVPSRQLFFHSDIVRKIGNGAKMPGFPTQQLDAQGGNNAG